MKHLFFTWHNFHYLLTPRYCVEKTPNSTNTFLVVRTYCIAQYPLLILVPASMFFCLLACITFYLPIPHWLPATLPFSFTFCGMYCYPDNRPFSTVPEFLDPRFRENKPKTLVFSHWKRAFWACIRENCVYNFGHRYISLLFRTLTIDIPAQNTNCQLAPDLLIQIIVSW